MPPAMFQALERRFGCISSPPGRIDRRARAPCHPRTVALSLRVGFGMNARAPKTGRVSHADARVLGCPTC